MSGNFDDSDNGYEYTNDDGNPYTVQAVDTHTFPTSYNGLVSVCILLKAGFPFVSPHNF